MVTFWYPADPPVAGVLPAPMWDQGLAADTSYYSALAAYGVSSADTRWALVVPKLVGHRFCGVPMAGHTVKYPVVLCSVVLCSPGWSVNRTALSQNAEELASHG